jgi:hypothetical protein
MGHPFVTVTRAFSQTLATSCVLKKAGLLAPPAIKLSSKTQHVRQPHCIHLTSTEWQLHLIPLLGGLNLARGAAFVAWRGTTRIFLQIGLDTLIFIASSVVNHLSWGFMYMLGGHTRFVRACVGLDACSSGWCMQSWGRHRQH